MKKYEQLVPDENQPKNEMKVYKERWLMLFIFSLITSTSAVIFMGLSSVAETVAPYYKVSTVQIEWLSNVFFIIFVIGCMPSAYITSRFGTRTILIAAAGCNAVSLSFHYAGCIKGNFYLVWIGQIIGGVGYTSILDIPGKLSADWFAPHERGIATGIGIYMNVFGIAIGFLQTSLMIPTTTDPIKLTVALRLLFLLRMIVAFVTVVATTFFFKEKPLTPPSIVEGREKLKFFTALKLLTKDVNFILVSQAYGLYFGLSSCVAVVLSSFVSGEFGLSTYVQANIGWMGFSGYIVAIFGFIAIGLYLGYYFHHKQVAIMLNAASFFSWLLFILTLLKSKNLTAVFIVYVIYCLFSIPYFSCGIEQVAEMTSPVSEAISSTVILIFGNLYGFILILITGKLIENGYPVISLCLILSLYFLSSLLVTVAKTELKRSAAEQKSMKYSPESSRHSGGSKDHEIANEEIGSDCDCDEKETMLKNRRH